MKKYFLLCTILILNTPGFAALQYKELLHVPWGNTPDRVALRSGPGGQFGPSSFRVNQNEIFILDSENQRILLYNSNLLKNIAAIQLPYTDDFLSLSEDHIILLKENELFELKNNLLQKICSPPDPRIIINDLKYQNRQISASQSNQITIFPVPGGLAKPSVETPVKVNKSSFYRAEIRTDQSESFSIQSNQANLGVVKYLGSTPNGNLYIYVEYITQQAPLKVDRYVQLYAQNGTLITKINIPQIQNSYIFREFDVDDQGNLYHMISAADGIHIIAWYNDLQETEVEEYSYPDKFISTYHYNQLETTPSEQLYFLKSGDPVSINASVTRNEALAIGDTYVKHVWTAAANNLTDGRIKDPAGADIETPSWLVIGQNTKIPYKWGGFWTLDGFDQGLLDGKYAGDIATSAVSSYCVGVDCSGFVSRCWKLSSHYSTRMMDDNITIAYDSWAKIKPGDAVHKVGHVRMFVEFNTDGSLLTVESAGRDWRVSYHSYTYSQLATYTPRYYINMEGSPKLIARPVLEHVVTSDSVTIAWDISDPGSISGYHLYLTYDGVNWEYATADNTLQQNSNHIIFEKDSDISCYFKITALAADDPSAEGYPSDTYGYRYLTGTDRILIVDGFDRLDGSYGAPNHEFAMHIGQALESYQVSFETIDNDDLLRQSVSLSNYDAVFWLLGDESVTSETFSTSEQSLVINYLQQGGKLFVSGSEVAWDLDSKGSTSDKDFIHNYLCATYYQDDSQSYNVNGVSGPFVNLELQYDDGTHGVYEENYPDALNISNNSTAILKYDNNKIAAVAKTGIFPGGSKTGAVIYMGFPFETIYDKSQQIALTGGILEYFGLIATGIENDESKIVKSFILHDNYPNPFNPSTTFHFAIPSAGDVNIAIYDLLGKKTSDVVRNNLPAGEHRINYDGSHLASGTYLYIIRWKDQQLKGRMQLIK
jgi:cell wall-associated NlpC family hydrolase